jgi:hypothetical protein
LLLQHLRVRHHRFKLQLPLVRVKLLKDRLQFKRLKVKQPQLSDLRVEQTMAQTHSPRTHWHITPTSTTEGISDDDQNPGSVPKNNAVDSTATSPGKGTGEGGQQITTVHRIDRSENGTPTAPEVQDPDVPQNDEASKYIYETSVIETGLAQKGLTQALADRIDGISTHRWR